MLGKGSPFATNEGGIDVVTNMGRPPRYKTETGKTSGNDVRHILEISLEVQGIGFKMGSIEII